MKSKHFYLLGINLVSVYTLSLSAPGLDLLWTNKRFCPRKKAMIDMKCLKDLTHLGKYIRYIRVASFLIGLFICAESLISDLILIF